MRGHSATKMLFLLWLTGTLVACTLLLGCESSSHMNRAAAFDWPYSYRISIPPHDPHFWGVPKATPTTEEYDYIGENGFCDPKHQPLSTFALDVDTASYSNVRRFIEDGQMPPRGAVRVEEMVNYFDYDFTPPPAGTATPIAIHTEVTDCPWNVGHRIACIGIKAKEVPEARRPASNLVFLVDVSGSMKDENKLPLVKRSLKLLTREARSEDHIGIVTYSGQARVHLPTHAGNRKQHIMGSIDELSAGGGTNGSGGIELAYQLIERSYIEGGINRVILVTDGDFNIGTTNRSDLVSMIEEKASDGIDLTILGFGTGNLKDSTMEQLADHGNGNYAYIDSLREAKHVMVDRLGQTVFTVARDVKFQVEFNPTEVAAYRLIGYENRMMANQEFFDDSKDAGDLGAGHCATALYEIIPVGVALDGSGATLRYQNPRENTPTAAQSGELLTVRLRFKNTDGSNGAEMVRTAIDRDQVIDECSNDLRFATAVAEFGLLLRDSDYMHRASFDQILSLARSARGEDLHGYRGEFIQLVETAQAIHPEGKSAFHRHGRDSHDH